MAAVPDNRCDRCGARAKARLDTEAGPLYFCGHCAVARLGDQVVWLGEPHLSESAPC